MKSKPGMIFVFLIFVAVILPFVSAYSPTFSSDVPANESVLYTPLKIALVPEAKEGGYAFAQYSRDLELWLTFEDNSSSALDSSTYGRHGTYRSNATRSTTLAKTGAGSLYIPGSFSHLLIPSSVNAAFDPARGYTVSFWFYPTQNNSGGTLLGSVGGIGTYQGTYFKVDNATNGGGNRMYQSYGAHTIIKNNPLLNRVNFSINAGQWTQLTFVNFKDYTLLYINGRLNGGSPFPQGDSCNPTFCTNRSTASFYIGSVQSFNQLTAMPGYFDDVIIFSRPLRENEVRDLYDYDGNFTGDIFLKSSNNLVTQVISTNSTGYIASSESRTFFPATTSAYVYQSHQRFEAYKNRSSSGIFTLPSFYPNESYYLDNSLWYAQLSYRINNGFWVQQGAQKYNTFNPGEWSGVFGDSIMGPGQTKTWPSYLDFYLHSYIYPNDSLMNGVGGHRCYQVLEQFTLYSINNTKAIINCGANDANDPAVTTNMSLTAIDSMLYLALQRNISVYLISVTPHENLGICTKIQAINSRFLWWYTYNNTNNFIKGYADVYNTPLKSQLNCGFNSTYFSDHVHLNDLGNIILAQTVWQQAFRGMVYDGWYNEFNTTAPGMYDLNWTITSPQGHNNSHLFKNAFYITPSAYVIKPNVHTVALNVT